MLIFCARIANKVSKVLSTFISTKLKFDIPHPKIVDDENHPVKITLWYNHGRHIPKKHK